MIKINYNGRIGNNIMQYVAALYIAKKNNLFLETTPVTIHNNCGALHISNIPERFHVQDFGELLNITKPPTNNSIYLGGRAQVVDDTNFHEYMDMKIEQPIQMNGFFQTPKFWVEKRDEIRKLFDLPTADEKINSLCVVYRSYKDLRIRGQTGANQYFEPCKYEYYDRMCDKISNFDSGFVISDEIESPEVQALAKKYSLEIVSLPPLQSILFARSFGKLIVGQGTFCYLCAYLSDTRTIMHPMLENYDPRVYRNPERYDWNPKPYDFITN